MKTTATDRIHRPRDAADRAVTIAPVDQLLERDAELDSLAATVERLADGAGAVVLVRGEAGIGKTSLVRALRERGQPPFHVGRCEPLSVPEPLGPIRELSTSVSAAETPTLVADDRRALARVLQTALTSRGPAVAVIEDAHWADPASLDVVRILARRAEDAPLALVLTLRDDELGANPALATLVGDLATDPAVKQIRLRPLSRVAIASLAADTDFDAGQLARVTGGNPFLVAETIAAGTALPDSVREATMARVSGSAPRRAASWTSPPSPASASDSTCSRRWLPAAGRRSRRRSRTGC